MKILVFSDIHGDLAALGRLLDIEVDLYFAAGDMVSWGRGLDKVGQVLARRREKMYVLPGNHESEAMIEEQCQRHGLIPFHGKAIEAGGYSIGGLGYSSITPFNTPGEYTEEEMARHLDPFRRQRPLIMVCHCPPYGTALDRLSGNAHAGSRAIGEFINETQPAAFFCGHIHEAHGVSCTLGQTKAWNAGKQGVVLDFAKLEA